MFKDYKKTSLEIWIENLYKSKGIFSPKDLTVKNISKTFNFSIAYIENAPNRAIWDEEDAVIFLNPNLEYREVKAIFFHELCHPLRHYGAQELMVNKEFRELQEDQANQFQIYAAMPFYMLSELDLPNSESITINILVEKFDIPYYLAKKRVEQIKRRIVQSHLDKQFKKIIKSENVFNYCKNIKPKSVPKHAEDIVALAISRKLSKEGISI